MSNSSFKNGRCTGGFEQGEPDKILEDAKSLQGNVLNKENISMLINRSLQRTGVGRKPKEIKELLKKFQTRGLV